MRGGLGTGTDKRGAHGCLLGSGHLPPWAGEGLAHSPSCGCNSFSSLSLPPSLRVSLRCFSLSCPLRIPSLAHPISVACGSWGHPTLLPCLLAWSCLLSRCLPQEVGTRRPRSPTLQERGLGAQTLGPGLTNRLRKCKAHRGVGPVPGAQTHLSLLVCLSHALLCHRPQQPLRLLCLSPPSPSQRP